MPGGEEAHAPDETPARAGGGPAEAGSGAEAAGTRAGAASAEQAGAASGEQAGAASAEQAGVASRAAPAVGTAPPVPDDADDLRGHHFKLLMRSGGTWAWILVPTVTAAVVLSAAVGPVAGLIALLCLPLLGVAICWRIADRRAADAFFAAYADQRGYKLGGRTTLPRATPLLRRGDDRYAERTLSGRLAPDCDGTLALFTYEEEHTDSNGNRETSYHRYTIGLTSIPECRRRVPELYCRRRVGPRALEKLEDVFRRSEQRIRLESTALDDKFEIFSGKDQDQNWLRQLFAPSFIVWLTDSAPPKFAFELVDGSLCCYVDGHREAAADLDRLAAATANVARRLREESVE